MSDSSEVPWAGGPNAPQIPSWVYTAEKEALAGSLIGAILYGIVVALFFKCMSSLLSADNRTRGGVKWILVAHTLAMFSFLTIPIGLDLDQQSIFYIDNREFPGNDEVPPGPIGYGTVIEHQVSQIVFIAMFPLNQWLADGLLLHRCYVIYSMNYWVMAFPCLIYLVTIAMGIVVTYQSSHLENPDIVANFGTSYYSISLSLNIILAVMIIARLVMHSRNVRKAIGASGKVSGLYTAIVTMLVESYALYAATCIMFIVPWAIQNWVVSVFSRFLGPVQVIAPFLIIMRVADRRALTSDVFSGPGASIGSLHFKSRKTTELEETLPDGDPVASTEGNGEASQEADVGTENVIEEVGV